MTEEQYFVLTFHPFEGYDFIAHKTLEDAEAYYTSRLDELRQGYIDNIILIKGTILKQEGEIE